MLTVEFDKLDLAPGSRVLDLGCGEGRHIRGTRLLAGVDAVALDLGEHEVTETRRSLVEMDEDPQALCRAAADAGEWLVVRGDIYHLPFPDGAFDCIIASEILEHLHRDDDAIGEIDRILKPGGVLAVSVPRYWPEAVCWALSTEYQNQPGGHVRIYSGGEIPAKLSGRGMAVFAGHYAHGLHAPYWWLKCLFGLDAEPNFLVALYHRMLVWEMFDKPLVLRTLTPIVDALAGKSEVFYARKPSAA